MKILQIVNIGYKAGGAEGNVFVMRNELRHRGHDVRVFSSDKKGEEMFNDYSVSILFLLQLHHYLKRFLPLHFFFHLVQLQSF